MSQFVGNMKEMSLGQLDDTVQTLQGVIDNIAEGGGAPGAPGSAPAASAATSDGGSILADLASNEVIKATLRGNIGFAANVAVATAEGMSGGAPKTSDPLFSAPGKRGRSSSFLSAPQKDRNTNALGLPMSYAEKKKAAQVAAKAAYKAQKGGAGAASKFVANGDPIASSIKIQQMSMGRNGQSVAPKGLQKLSRNDVIQLGLVPASIVHALGEAQNMRERPSEMQLVKSLEQGDARAETMVLKTSAETQQHVMQTMSPGGRMN